MCWNYDDDELIFDVKVTRGFVELEPTKRNVVSVESRFYDTLRIVSPVTIQFKVFFQILSLAKVLWDELYSSELLNKWQLLLLSLRKQVHSVFHDATLLDSFAHLHHFV